MVFQFLTERVCQARETADARPNVQVHALDMRRTDLAVIALAENLFALGSAAHAGAIAAGGAFVGRIGENLLDLPV